MRTLRLFSRAGTSKAAATPLRCPREGKKKSTPNLFLMTDLCVPFLHNSSVFSEKMYFRLGAIDFA